MPVSYNGKKIIPAPLVDISKDYVKASDGEKIGTTFTITLDGVMLPHKGSPNSQGAFHSDHGYPADEYIPENKLYYSLLKKTEALRDLFSSEGQMLKIGSWYDEDDDGDDNAYPAISGYPRVVNLSFPANQYVSNPQYNITMEMDEVFGMKTSSAILGQEDFRNISDNIIPESGNAFSDEFNVPITSNGNKIYLSAANESWNADNANQPKGCSSFTIDNTVPAAPALTYTRDESPTFTLTHTVSSTGKRAYFENELIRQPWENARLWVEQRLAFPSGNTITDLPIATTHVQDMFDVGPSGVGFQFEGNEYGAYNHVRSQQIDRKGGTFSATDTWLLARNDIYAVMENLSVDTTYDDSAEGTNSMVTVAVNGSIQGLGEQNKHNQVIRTKYENAMERFEHLSENSTAINGILPLLAKDVADLAADSYMTVPHLTKTVQKNQSTGLITFSYVYNNRSQSIAGSVSESATFTEVVGIDKYAIIEVPHRSAGPIVEDLGTKELSTATCSISVTIGTGSRVSKPTLTDGNTTLFNMCGVPDGHHVRGNTGTLIVTADQESWDAKTGRYTKTKTFQYSCTTS